VNWGHRISARSKVTTQVTTQNSTQEPRAVTTAMELGPPELSRSAGVGRRSRLSFRSRTLQFLLFFQGPD
jgi:hypothetical protein